MKRIAIMTDSNSGITQAEAKSLGISVLPMPFTINDELYFEDITLDQPRFYELLLQGADVSTSQPSLHDVAQLWEELLKTHESVVHIPMSSALSATCSSAVILSAEYGGRVHVVDNKTISVTQRQAVLHAIALAESGADAAEIKKILENHSGEASVYIMVDTLKYLKKGGRITPAAAAIGTVLNIKPVLQLQGGQLDAYLKVKGVNQSKKAMIAAMKKDFETRFAGRNTPDKMDLMMAYTYNKDAALAFKSEVEAAFPGFDIYMAPLSLSVSCHVGPGALAVACMAKI